MRCRLVIVAAPAWTAVGLLTRATPTHARHNPQIDCAAQQPP
jgi:hypothetical protein